MPEETVREKKKAVQGEEEERQGTGKRRKVEEKIGQRDEGVIKQERGCEAEQPVGDGVGWGGGCCVRPGTQSSGRGGCLDRCRLPLGSPRSSINRPPHNPALPTVRELCPETHRVALASGAQEAGEDGYVHHRFFFLSLIPAERAHS